MDCIEEKLGNAPPGAPTDSGDTADRSVGGGVANHHYWTPRDETGPRHDNDSVRSSLETSILGNPVPKSAATERLRKPIRPGCDRRMMWLAGALSVIL